MNKNYAICYNPAIKDAKNTMIELKSVLENSGLAPQILDIDNLKSGFDFVFVIGGDGTILKASRYYAKFETLIFGINLGHLGFLSQAGGNNLEQAVYNILRKDYKIEKRLMLEANNFNALNDFVIKGEQSSRASKFILEIDDKFVCDYYSDGVIVSTPTGSTAYSMAAGGPVLAPNIEALVITPICPHTFSARPLVVGAQSEIKISCPTDVNYCVSADGQEVFSFSNQIKIMKSSYFANLALLNQNEFYSILRNKLHWGINPINAS